MYKGGILGRMSNYSAFTLLSSVGFRVTFSIDLFMVTSLLNMTIGGVYSIAVMIANLIEIPFNSVEKSTNMRISKYWSQGDHGSISKTYKEVGLDAFLISCILYLCVITNLDSIFELMANGDRFTGSRNIIIIIGASKVLNTAFSVNSGVISFSEHYHFNIAAISILAIVTIALNYLFIPLLGADGAALSTFMALLIFNLSKYLFIRFKFGFRLFSLKYIKVILLSITAGGICLLLPADLQYLLAIAIKTSIIILVFMLGILYFDTSYVLKQKIIKYIGKQEE
jgi:O-antigen/teichoic acid export membrane protein